MQITIEERQRIALYHRGRWGVRHIARKLGRDHSVISRELRRNTLPGARYDPERAQRLALERTRRRRRTPKLDADERLRRYVFDRLSAGWAPHVVSGVLERSPPPELEGRTVSHETIYRYVYEGEGRFRGWWHLLPSSRPRRKKRRSRKKRMPGIPNCVSVHDRPDSADDRSEVGHWESDSVLFSKGRAVLSVQIERTMRLVRITKVNDKSAGRTLETLAGVIEDLPADMRQSITFDNGTEGARHRELTDRYGVRTYFCDPYASWQKGSVENVNRIIRRFLPRSTDLSEVTDDDVRRIQEWINDMPRKVLGYKSPNQCLREHLGGAFG